MTGRPLFECVRGALLTHSTKGKTKPHEAPALDALAEIEAALEVAYALLDGEGYFCDPDYPEAQKIAMALGV